MARERLARIVASLPDEGEDREALDHLCRACVEELDVTGAGLALLVGGHHRGTLGVSSAHAARVEELQFTLGEGPCLESFRERRTVQEPALASSARWPAFGPEAVTLGVQAVFALPLSVGAAGFGSLDLYCDHAGSLGDGVLGEARVVADMATAMVMGIQARTKRGSPSELLAPLADQRAVVHQATGMVSVQLGASLDEALVAVRARAYADGRSLGVVAADIVDRRLRLER